MNFAGPAPIEVIFTWRWSDRWMRGTPQRFTGNQIRSA
jgi:hypothetical protein